MTATVFAFKQLVDLVLDPYVRAKIVEILPAMANEVVLVILATLLLTFLQCRYRLLSDFLAATAHPLNLAVARITVFSVLLSHEKHWRILMFSSLPDALQVPPFGWGLILRILRVQTHVVEVLYYTFAAMCVAAILGISTRFTCLLAALLAIYVLGIPQFYGAVNHYHHLIWFALILGFSRCADALSVDSIFQALRRADKGDVESPTASTGYGLPLRFMMALLGVVYFFPGTWKIARGGWAWIASDNLRTQMYQKWAEFGTWTPSLRIDLHPGFVSLLALGTIGFEISFGFLILWPLLRPFAAAAALAFHNGIAVMMGIRFAALQFMFVMFVNWKELFVTVANKMFATSLPVIYDDSCKLCRRIVAVLNLLNWGEKVCFVPASDNCSLRRMGAEQLVAKGFLETFAALTPQGWEYGYGAYLKLIPRIPLLSPLWLIMVVPPARLIGEKVALANSRLCSLTRGEVKNMRARTKVLPARALWLIGVSLLGVNILFGTLHITASWPPVIRHSIKYNGRKSTNS